MRLILIFVSLSILGIFFFQGYWLWNSYRIEKKQFQTKINETLQLAINQEIVDRMDRMQKDTTPGAPHGQIEFQFRLDSTSNATSNRKKVNYYARAQYQTQSGEDSTTYQSFKPENSPMMQAAFKGIWQALNGISPVDIAYVDSLWGTYLQQEGIGNVHFVDFTLGRDTLLDTSLPDTLNPSDLLATQKIGVNTDNSIGMQGFIIGPGKSILDEMGSLLLVSLFLIIITTACYIYLLRTILRQKTIAEIKNDFVNNMTHELKTPITITYSAIDALQNFNFVEQRETREEYFTLCRQQLKHLSGLVEKILSMAVDERKNFRLQKELFALQPVLDSLIQQFTLKTGKPLRFHIDDQLGDHPVYADKLHFVNVISNLLDNAVKYSGPSVEIHIRLQRTGGELQISITDNGIGIPAGQQERIFERFYRVSKGNVHDVKGFGLGLSYVKDIVERHGGTISVHSREKHGSTFTLFIPEKK